ncbi:MAG: rubredoxin [Nitrospirota bacterium]
MSKYQCISACGYVYDPHKGDPNGGIHFGTPFEQLPEDWVCPVCGVVKRKFKKVV